MHFKFRHVHKIVGAFFLLTCMLLFLLLALVARGQHWFQKYVPYTTSFSEAKGVSSGASVMLRGLEIGKVESVALTKEGRVSVALAIYDHYADRVKEGTETELVAPFIGSSQVTLLPGPEEGKRLLPGSFIPAHEKEGEGLDALVATVQSLVKQLENPQGDLMQTLKNVNGMTKSLDEAMSQKDGSLYRELITSVRHLDSVLATLDDANPDIRDAIGEARRGLEEANKVVVALQKSIFFRGNIEKSMKENSTLVVEGR